MSTRPTDAIVQGIRWLAAFSSPSSRRWPGHAVEIVLVRRGRMDREAASLRVVGD